MFVVGGSLILQSTASNTILQTIVEEDKRGRVLSLYSIAFTSMATFGNLLCSLLSVDFAPKSAEFYSGEDDQRSEGLYARHSNPMQDLNPHQIHPIIQHSLKQEI
jgi:MFS family permease